MLYRFNIWLLTLALLRPGFLFAQACDPSAGICNPLKAQSLTALLQDILNALIVLAIPVIVFFIIYAGFLYVTARGNSETVGKAHRALLYALIGGVLILGANVLVSVISGTVDTFKAEEAGASSNTHSTSSSHPPNPDPDGDRGPF